MLSTLPDNEPMHVAWRDRTLTTTLGELRERLGVTEETPKAGGREAEIVRIAVRECTKNYSRRQCQSESGPTRQGSEA